MDDAEIFLLETGICYLNVTHFQAFRLWYQNHRVLIPKNSGLVANRDENATNPESASIRVEKAVLESVRICITLILNQADFGIKSRPQSPAPSPHLPPRCPHRYESRNVPVLAESAAGRIAPHCKSLTYPQRKARVLRHFLSADIILYFKYFLTRMIEQKKQIDNVSF